MNSFDTEYEIYFEDISPSGMVHLEKIAEWMSMGRERFFKTTCPNHLSFSDGKVSMFTVFMTISDVKNSQWADDIKAIITFTKVKRISFEIHFDFYNKRKKETIAKGVQKVAFIDSGEENFAPIPADIKNAVSQHMKKL